MGNRKDEKKRKKEDRKWLRNENDFKNVKRGWRRYEEGKEKWYRKRGNW